LECTRSSKPGEEPKFLKYYKAGEAFGELALLYNAPRAANIKAMTNSVLFALDRACFNHIVKGAAVTKRERYETFLAKIELLDTMDPYERTKIADVIETKKFNKGEYIIREGEKGNTFFFIELGHCVATKKKGGNSSTKEPHLTFLDKEEIVYKYNQGDYFGELALLKDQPRAASIVAAVISFFPNLHALG